MSSLDGSLLPSTTLHRRLIEGISAAVYHVVEHFGVHTGQIVWIAKARSGESLGFSEEKPGGRAKLTWVPTPAGPIAP